MFLDCPACLDDEGTIRCGLPAEVRCRFTIRSSDGPLEAAMITCPSGHSFNGPIESLTCDSKDKHDPRAAAAVADASRGGSPAGRGRRGGSAVQYSSPEPDQHVHRPNGAPAYYLGRPVCLYLTAMSPRRRDSTPKDLTNAPAGGRERTLSRYSGPFPDADSEARANQHQQQMNQSCAA
jgi:hypothetical protein